MYEQMAIERLKGFGISVTKPRIAIMSYLMQNHIHPNVDDIYSALKDSMPSLSRTTVYNTLKQFAENKAVTFLTIDERNVCIEENMAPHGHFLCTSCGKVYDIPLPSENMASDKLDGCRVDEVHLYYKGVCRSCIDKTKTKE